MNELDFLRLYPNLYHMASDGSWPSIAKLGLLSTGELVRLWHVLPEALRRQLVEQRRPSSVTISSEELGTALIRDQKPLDEKSLAAALTDGLTPSDWYEILNERVFFFVQPERLATLMNAVSYRNETHTVITLDTASFLAAHRSEVELCKINSGFAQPHNHTSRGPGTFQALEAYVHPSRLSPRLHAPWDVAELCVKDGVFDINQHVKRVERRRRDDVVEVVLAT